MKKHLLLAALVFLLGFQLQAQSCAFAFAVGTVNTSETCTPTGSYTYNINVSATSDSTLAFSGLWSEPQSVSADIDCNTQTFTIPQQPLLTGYDIQGNGSIVGPNVQISYGVYQMPGHTLVDSCTMIYSLPVLAVAPSAQASLTLYPNPATGRAYIHLQAPSATIDACTYLVYDSQGRAVATGILDSHLEAQINLKTLTKGMYRVMVQSAEGPLASKVLVVQ